MGLNLGPWHGTTHDTDNLSARPRHGYGPIPPPSPLPSPLAACTAPPLRHRPSGAAGQPRPLSVVVRRQVATVPSLPPSADVSQPVPSSAARRVVIPHRESSGGPLGGSPPGGVPPPKAARTARAIGTIRHAESLVGSCYCLVLGTTALRGTAWLALVPRRASAGRHGPHAKPQAPSFFDFYAAMPPSDPGSPITVAAAQSVLRRFLQLRTAPFSVDAATGSILLDGRSTTLLATRSRHLPIFQEEFRFGRTTPAARRLSPAGRHLAIASSKILVSLDGFVTDGGYSCACSAAASCGYRGKVLSALQFEKHAGVKSKNQNGHIFLSNGISLYSLFQELRDVPAEAFAEKFEAAAGVPMTMASRGKDYSDAVASDDGRSTQR
ncbi:hypothetical protein HU200_000357 [Digitaria exilis]|uniref:Tify domain-containing protein n=1 Tax=Digitaria exilis TaxID=1010633 RepID=A0A835G367_9POAL|nr:hypothetical protein HU200_000357 [Digitaria exilis]